MMEERFDQGIRFKKIEGAKPRPKDTRPKPAPVKIEVKPEPIKPPEPPKLEVTKPEVIKTEEKPVKLPTPEPIKQEPPKGPPKIEILIPEKVKTGVFIFVPDMFDKVANVYLNNSCLNQKTDYLIQGKNICFSFNVRKNEKLVIEGKLE